MNNYVDVYFSRINHMGDTTAERIRNGGIRSFYKWMAESPFTVNNLSVERGVYFSGIIEENKDKDAKKIMFLQVSNNTNLVVGDIMNWILDDGTIEKWILLKEEKKTNPTYRTFWIIRCNYLIRWVDSNGHIQECWSYVVSSEDSKIKGNFRTWNSLITPQPNKYLEILMPRRAIDRATNFIIEQESWTVVEYDHTSVTGIIYLSLTEGKINSIYDEVEHNLADTDKVAKYTIATTETPQIFHVGDTVSPTFTLLKNGSPTNEAYTLLSSNKAVVNDALKAVGEGEAAIIVELQSNPSIHCFIPIVVSAAEPAFVGYIEGEHSLRLDRKATYYFKSDTELVDTVTFSLDKPLLATIINTTNNSCEVKANNKNNLGSITLTATYQNKIYSFVISIIPLW